MKSIFRPAIVLFGALTLLTGVAYPLVVTGAAQALFPAKA
ncbi:MAG: potassium-transporting ATPase subunit C, partial [Polaromonas sp.]|nr:potassium-transporting ATPase subunit C [Polaromonas sp.]